MPMSMRIQFPLQFNAFKVRFGRRWIMCNSFQGSNFLQGAKSLFREIENSLRGANNLFRESENSFQVEIYNRLWEAKKSSIVPSTHFFWETTDYLGLEAMNKAIISPVFVEQRHLIERVECFCCFQYKDVVHVVRLFNIISQFSS